MKYKTVHNQRGFTLVELMLVIVLLVVGFGLVLINGSGAVNDNSLENVAQTLVADLKSQQLKAMSGDSGSDGVTEPFGIRFGGTNYTLFKDAAYNGASADNYTVQLPSNTTVATTFASSQVAFAQSSGDVNSFSAVANTVTVTNTTTSDSIVISLNRYGAITKN